MTVSSRRPERGEPCRLQWCRKAACGGDETQAEFQNSGWTSGGQEEGMWVAGNQGQGDRTRRGGHGQRGRGPCCCTSPRGSPVLETAGGHRASLKKKDLFTLIIWPHRGSAATCGIFCCSVWDLVPCRGSHLGPPSLGARS